MPAYPKLQALHKAMLFDFDPSPALGPFMFYSTPSPVRSLDQIIPFILSAYTKLRSPHQTMLFDS